MFVKQCLQPKFVSHWTSQTLRPLRPSDLLSKDTLDLKTGIGRAGLQP